MYSRYGDSAKRPVQLPEHYGGSAFSQQPTSSVSVPKREAPRTILREGVEEKASPIADRLLRAESIEEEAVPAPLPDVEATPAVPEAPEENGKANAEKAPLSMPFHFGALRRLLASKEGGGEDQDRLLLLGLILLLSRTEGESDVLLWLSLLLLCG